MYMCKCVNAKMIVLYSLPYSKNFFHEVKIVYENMLKMFLFFFALKHDNQKKKYISILFLLTCPQCINFIIDVHLIHLCDKY